MEHGKLNFVERDDSIFAGAIFISNRETKLECLQRKLFGLPLSKFKFLKQVKAGMILFLFEHEERKLYGVFEATSDGALNIIPDAFKSTVRSYPAQILFKRIWMCKPLCEDEFRSAIKENYYSPNKFHFGLSYKQVIKLIHLFHSRKININESKGHEIPNKIIDKFESSTVDEVSLTETGKYFERRSDSIERNYEVRSQLAQPQCLFDPPIQYTRPASTMNMFPLSYPPNSYSETLNSQIYSTFLPDDPIASRHLSIEKTSEIEYKPSPLHSSRYKSNLDDMVAPYSIGLNQQLSPDMTPRMAMIQEEASPASCHVMNDSSHQTGISQHARVSGARPDHLFECSDYIPLVEESQREHFNSETQNYSLENSEYIPSTRLNSYIPCASKENSKYFYCADGYSGDGYSGDDELKTYQRAEADGYTAVRGALYADSDLIWPSFYQKTHDHETPEPSRASSLNKFLDSFSTRINGWSAMEVSKQLVDCDVNEKHVSGYQNKITQLPVDLAESSEIDQYDDIIDPQQTGLGEPSNDVLAEESFELPFYDFRRRSTCQTYEMQDYSNECDDVCGSREKLMESKRRRIVRPSLYEEMHENVKAKAEKKKTEAETSSLKFLDSENESKGNAVNSFFDSMVPMLQTVRKKYEPVGESLEQNHATSVEESLDYIPIG